MAGKTLDVQSLISKDCTVDGDLSLSGTVKVDGHVNGSIRTRGDVIVSPKATVNGDITARNILIAGTVTGNATAKGQVSMMSKGVLKGDLTYGAMAMEDDAEVSGACTLRTTKR